MMIVRNLRRVGLLNSLVGYRVSNISKKEVRYCFDAVSVQKIHPTRNLSQGTDRLLVSPNLLVMADHGCQTPERKGVNLDDSFSKKLIAIINSFFYKDPFKYCQGIYDLVESAVNVCK